MASRTRTQLLYLGSKNRQKREATTPSDFELAFDTGCIELHLPGFIRATVLEVTMPRSWFNVTEMNSIFVWRNHTQNFLGLATLGVYPRTLPLEQLQANFNLTQMAENMKRNLPPGWDCKHLPDQGVIEWTVPSDGQVWGISFLPDKTTHELLGFDVTDKPTAYYSTPPDGFDNVDTPPTNKFRSKRPARASSSTSVVVHATLPKARMSVMNNTSTQQSTQAQSQAQGKLMENDSLVKFPIDKAPFDTLTYTASHADLFSFDLTASKIHNMRIFVTDEHQRPLLLTQDWTFTLRLDYHHFSQLGLSPNTYSPFTQLTWEEAVVALLERMRDSLHLLALSDKNP